MEGGRKANVQKIALAMEGASADRTDGNRRDWGAERRRRWDVQDSANTVRTCGEEAPPAAVAHGVGRFAMANRAFASGPHVTFSVGRRVPVGFHAT